MPSAACRARAFRADSEREISTALEAKHATGFGQSPTRHGHVRKQPDTPPGQRYPQGVQLTSTRQEEALYRAVESRDRRFEGRFVLGVSTTGIYCRPGCPARMPKRPNMRFFACPAAAEQAGFRACLRCRPETSPGTPAWIGTGATVARALRLIGEGGLDDAGVEVLASRLGIGDRHLRRLFAEQLGASPLAVARSRRLHFARKLLDETSLPMTEVALGSGFSSTRRFNDEIRRAFGESPTELRRSRSQKTPLASEATGLGLRLAYKPPYAFAALLAFLKARAIPGVEIVDGDRYLRTVSIDGSRGLLEVRPREDEACLELRVSFALSHVLFRVVSRVGQLFDLGADPLVIDDHLRNDPRLARAVDEHPGVRVPGAWDGFELVVRAILGQQISVKGATTLSGRLVARFGEPLAAPVPAPGSPNSEGIEAAGLTHLFPTPAALAEADLAAIGLPRARAETIRRLAAAARDGALALDAPSEDPARQLTSIPGIGPWTAAYVAMRAHGEPDAFPVGDLALSKALGGLTPREIERRAEAFRPWRAYAAMRLWMDGANPTQNP
jgi:AraC family transcriptional regulator, regulatory protein of adaptative response / DNA-3-methyladenine glycosylase II